MKRLLSIFIAVIMVAAMVLPTTAVFADEGAFDPFAGDHVKGEMPENLINKFEAAMWTTGKNDTEVELAGVNWKNANASTGWPGGYMGGKLYTTSGVQTVDAHLNSAGFAFQSKYINKEDASYLAGEHYVFMFAVRNANTAVPASVRVGAWNGTYSGNVSKDFLPVPEYPEGLMEVPQTGEWVTFKGTIPSTPNRTVPSIRMGLPKGTPAGAAVEFNALHDGVLQPYYALEVPHYITLAPVADAAVIKGIPAQYKAQLLNQIDSTGFLAQNFTYTVFGADGEAVEGLTVENAEGVAVINAGDAVAEGTYYLRATTAIDADTTWQKTVAFNVRSALERTDDYIVGAMPDNLVNSSSFNGTGNSSVVSYSGQYLPAEVTQGQSVTALFASARADDPFPYPEYNFDYNKGNSGGDYWGVEGVIIKFKNEYATQHARTDTTYVVSAKVRSTVGGHIINTTYARDYNVKYTTYADGKEGFLVEGTDWQDYKAVITTDLKGTNERKGSLLFGLVHAPADSYLLINLTPGLYVAEEVAYDIKVDGESNTVVAGSAMNLSASVENQIGIEGKLDQSFNWVAVTPDRMNYVDGITFEPSNDGANVTVNVADTVDAGEYIIVAQSEEYNMNRQYPITVTAPTYDVTELTLNTTATGATLEALTVNTNKTVKVVLAAFAGNKVVTSNKTEITPVDGVAALADPLAISGLSAGDKVRVFVWDEFLTPFSMKSTWKAPVTIK